MYSVRDVWPGERMKRSRPIQSGFLRVVPHQLLEQKVSGRSQAHRGAGVAVAHLLHGVGGQDTHGVNGALVEVGPGQFLLFHMCHGIRAPLCVNGKR